MRDRIAAMLGLGLAALLVASAAPAWAAFQDENLITLVPKGFTIGKQGQAGPMIISEFVPQGETVDSWTRMVTVQVFRNIKTGDPDRFAEGIRTMWTGACPGADVMKIKDVVEHGYPVAIWQFLCPNNPQTGKPENMYTKIIGGTDALYSIQYAYRSVLTKEMIPPTMSYLGGVFVCDTRLPDRPCPTVSP